MSFALYNILILYIVLLNKRKAFKASLPLCYPSMLNEVKNSMNRWGVHIHSLQTNETITKTKKDTSNPTTY